MNSIYLINETKGVKPTITNQQLTKPWYTATAKSTMFSSQSVHSGIFSSAVDISSCFEMKPGSLTAPPPTNWTGMSCPAKS